MYFHCLYMFSFYTHLFGFTCERELLCAATTVPPWCAPPLRPNGAESGLAHHLHLADESLWWSPIICGMYWCARTSEKRGMRRRIRLWKNSFSLFWSVDLWNRNAFCARPAAQQSQRPGGSYSTVHLGNEASCSKTLKIALTGLEPVGKI